MWHSRPPRDPPPLHGKCHLKFPFDYLTPSLNENDYLQLILNLWTDIPWDLLVSQQAGWEEGTGVAVVWGSPRLTKLGQTSFIVIASRTITQDDFGVVRIPDLSHSSGIVYTKKSDQKNSFQKVLSFSKTTWHDKGRPLLWFVHTTSTLGDG